VLIGKRTVEKSERVGGFPDSSRTSRIKSSTPAVPAIQEKEAEIVAQGGPPGGAPAVDRSRPHGRKRTEF